MNKNYLYMLSLTIVCAVLFAFFSCDGTSDNEGVLGVQGKLITDVPMPNGVKMWSVTREDIPNNVMIYKLKNKEELDLLVAKLSKPYNSTNMVTYYDGTSRSSHPLLRNVEAMVNPEQNPPSSNTKTFSVAVDSVNVFVTLTFGKNYVSSRASGSNPSVINYGWQVTSSSCKVDSVSKKMFYTIEGTASYHDIRCFYAWYDFNNNNRVDDLEYIYVELPVSGSAKARFMGDR